MPLKDLVPGVLRSLKPKEGGLDDLRRIWSEVVGEATASRTRLKAFEQGILTVEVASSALKHDLATFRREAVLEGLRKAAPGVDLRGLTCRVGSVR